MSTTHSAMQYNTSFAPKRLCNWEVPAVRATTPAAHGAGFRTQTLVDDKGHLLPGVPKMMTSFSTGYETTGSARWPTAQKGPSAPFGGSAGMGYKGIITSYLPTSQVTTRNNPDTKETNYH
jgi:hypothetical protein